jgi:hypothetical protein
VSEIIKRILLKEDVCLVEEKNYILVASSLKDLRELPFQLYCFGRQFFNRDLDN